MSDFTGADPFPHVVLDNIWPAELLMGVAAEAIMALQHAPWKRFQSDDEVKLEGSDPAYWGPYTRQLWSQIANGTFCDTIEQMTGLRAFWDYYGGGWHVIPTGGRLGVHTDYNRHPSGLYRRLNMLIFLNPKWDDYGGHLELHNDEECVVTVSPEFNRTVIMESSDRSWHGHPVPTQHRTRMSFAAYAFTPDPGPSYTSDHSTIYRRSTDA